MVKEDIHSYIKTIGIIATILIAVGIAKEQITGNKDDIKVCELDIKDIGKDVHNLQLEQGKLIGISENTLKVLSGIQASLDVLKNSYNTQTTAIALIQKDVSNLEIVE